MNVLDSSIFVRDVALIDIETALVAAIAEMADVDVGAVVVTLTLRRRLQAEAAAFSILTAAYTIKVQDDGATAIATRLNATDLGSATTVVTQHLNDAGVEGTFRAVSLSANVVGSPDDGSDAEINLTVFLFIGAVAGSISVILVALCCCCICRCCCGNGKAGRQEELIPV